MHCYTAYGLTIASDRPLPELVALEDSPAQCDVEIVRAPVAEVGYDQFDFTEREATLQFGLVGRFKITQGARIEVDPIPAADDDLVRVPLLGAAIAVLLHQRGIFALHASAVAIDDRAAVFIGQKGQGKSTMTATMYGRGHQLIADDIVAIESDGDGFTVRPGFPQLKLGPDSLQSALGIAAETLPLVTTYLNKRACRVSERFATRNLPLSRVYILLDGEWELSPLPPQEALRHVIMHSYAARFGHALLQGKSSGQHLQMCAQLISRDRVRKLQRPRDFDQLAEVARRVEEDVAAA